MDHTLQTSKNNWGPSKVKRCPEATECVFVPDSYTLPPAKLDHVNLGGAPPPPDGHPEPRPSAPPPAMTGNKWQRRPWMPVVSLFHQ